MHRPGQLSLTETEKDRIVLMGELRCSKCKVVKPLSEFHRNAAHQYGYCPQCKSCKKADTKSYYQRLSPEEKKAHNRRINSSRYLRLFGITEQDYLDRLAAQDGRCAICHRENPHDMRLSVDHDHACCNGQVTCGKCLRGLLCADCNSGIGQLRDDPDVLRRAADYLEMWKEAHGHGRT